MEKMGQLIDQLATQVGHEIVERIHLDNRNRLSEINTESTDVAIDFSQPEAAMKISNGVLIRRYLLQWAQLDGWIRKMR